MASDSSCNDINDCRKLYDIVWGCLVTIFACTWISVHPNVSPPHCGPISIALRRCVLMVIAVVAPELMVYFAMCQFMVARKFSKDHNLSMTHGFFISMGGFVTRQGHHPIISRHQLTKEILREIRATKTQDIEDKSKGDAVSKGLALLQTLWFLVQILTRHIQHLPITTLEMATVGFAILNLLMYRLWWYKPLDVKGSIMIGPGPEVEISTISRRRWFSSAQIWRFLKLVIYGGYNFKMKSKSVPIVWAGIFPESGNQAVLTVTRVVASIVACLFGAIHCFAWNFSFPTSMEQMMWRISSVFIALFPSSFPLDLAMRYIMKGPHCQPRLKRFQFLRYIELYLDDSTFQRIIGCTGLLLYVVCRLILLTITVTTLRSLPPDAYRDIDWTRYLPHM